LSDRLEVRAMRCVPRIARDLNPNSLRESIWVLSTLLRFGFGVYIADAELSTIFHHTGSWATNMTTNSKSFLLHPSRADQKYQFGRARPKTGTDSVLPGSAVRRDPGDNLRRD
jgi:hypothetical protein